MNTKDQRNQHALIARQLDDAFYSISNSACLTECTGLIYRAAQNMEEEDMYNDIYHFLPPKKSLKNIDKSNTNDI